LNHWQPLSKPFVIKRVLHHEAYGTFKEEDGTFIIKVRIDKDPIQECETLVHEWAHALTHRESRCEQLVKMPCGTEIKFNGQMPFVRHGDEWGIAYAKCYRAVRCLLSNEFGPDHPEMDYRL
jgi:hypothetical protein